MPAAPTPQRLRELARFFAWLGIVGFGGPAAHIALMQREVVDRRGWLSQAEFLDLLGATNLIPGPNSTEMAIHIGHRRAGWPGCHSRSVLRSPVRSNVSASSAWVSSGRTMC